MVVAWHWWLTPIILATWETEIKRIMVWSQPRRNSSKTLPLLKIPNTKNSWWSGSSGRAPV
jgi:hypothetical protein